MYPDLTPNRWRWSSSHSVLVIQTLLPIAYLFKMNLLTRMERLFPHAFGANAELD